MPTEREFGVLLTQSVDTPAQARAWVREAVRVLGPDWHPDDSGASIGGFTAPTFTHAEQDEYDYRRHRAFAELGDDVYTPVRAHSRGGTRGVRKHTRRAIVNAPFEDRVFQGDWR